MKPTLNKCHRERPIIPIHHHIDRCEGSKCRFFVMGNFVWYNPTPEWIKCGRGKDVTTIVGIENEIIKTKLYDVGTSKKKLGVCVVIN